jgi:hypothetical protein
MDTPRPVVTSFHSEGIPVRSTVTIPPGALLTGAACLFLFLLIVAVYCYVYNQVASMPEGVYYG